MNVTDPFADVAADYAAWFDSPLGAFVDQQELGTLDHVLHGVARGRVLEVGAGTGHVSNFLARSGFHVAALEPSVPMRTVGEATTAGLPVEWFDGRAENLPFDDGRFDAALFFTTIEFVHDPAQAVREALRVVRAGGWLVVAYLHALSPWAALYRHEADLDRLPWAVAHLFTRAQLEGLVGGGPATAASAVFLAPEAMPPFDVADDAGRRAGNAPALEVLLWRKP